MLSILKLAPYFVGVYNYYSYGPGNDESCSNIADHLPYLESKVNDFNFRMISGKGRHLLHCEKFQIFLH